MITCKKNYCFENSTSSKKEKSNKQLWFFFSKPWIDMLGEGWVHHITGHTYLKYSTNPVWAPYASKIYWSHTMTGFK